MSMVNTPSASRAREQHRITLSRRCLADSTWSRCSTSPSISPAAQTPHSPSVHLTSTAKPASISASLAVCAALTLIFRPDRARSSTKS
jgi:hypothetical protein